MKFKINVEKETPKYAHIFAILGLVVLIIAALGVAIYAMLIGTKLDWILYYYDLRKKQLLEK